MGPRRPKPLRGAGSFGSWTAFSLLDDGTASPSERRLATSRDSQRETAGGGHQAPPGGLAPNATVMSWRGTKGGIEAARQGHDVIMTPVEHAYFDFYQGDAETEPLAMNWAGFAIDLARAYAFEPVPEELTEAQARHVLGPQGNVWTEYISTPEYVEYMAYPRALALAEVAWSPRGARDYDGFVERLRALLPLLDRMELSYRPLDP
ncbi:MAG: family 20 glycosylhydrolase [Acidobacteriota bacterium]